MSDASLASDSKPAHPARTASWLGKLLWSLALAVAFVGGWVVAGNVSGRAEKEPLPPADGPTGRDPAAVLVTVDPVSRRPVQRSVEAIGTLHGFEEVTISAKVEGRVRKLCCDVADRLAPGSALMEIDPTDHDLAVQQAERGLLVELAKLGLSKSPEADLDLGKLPTVAMAQTRMDNAQAKLERTRRLASSRTASAEDLETAASDARAAKAEHANQLLLARSGLATVQMKQSALAMARQQLDDTRVRAPTPNAPVPGVERVSYAVTHRAVAEGTLVRPGSELCKLVIDGTLKVRLPVPERHGGEVKLGQKAEVRTAAFPRPFAGSVTRIGPSVDPLTRTFEVEIQVPNPDRRLKPGNFAKVAVLTRLDPDVVTVPLSAVVNFAGINKVFLAADGRATSVSVTLGAQSGDWVEIASPALPAGAKVVTSGQTLLADGSAVEVREAKEAGR